MNLNHKIEDIIEKIIHISEGYDNRCPNEVYSTLQKIGKQLQELKEYKPKVKQLNWRVFDEQEEAPLTDINLISYYTILKGDKRYELQYWENFYGYSVIGYYKYVEKAKAAAQSHYESLILGCLENE